MSDQFRESIEEAYERGVEAGRLDAVPPNTEPMEWCGTHNMPWNMDTGCLDGWIRRETLRCQREVKVTHWVTVKEETA